MPKSMALTGYTLEDASFEVRQPAPASCAQGETEVVPAGHAATISTLSYAIRFWSKGTKRALFLRHEGFL